MKFSNNLMKAAVAVLCAASLASCFKDVAQDTLPTSGDGGLETVNISVNVPGNAGSETRALNAAAGEEINITEVDVLQFKPNGTFVHRAVGSSITIDGPDDRTIGYGKRNFEVKLLTGTYDIVVIANARAIVNDAVNGTNGVTAWDENTTIQVALDRLAIAIAADEKITVDVLPRLPMFGITKNKTVDKDHRDHTIELVRMLAKIDVQVNFGVYSSRRFLLGDVRLYNQALKGWIAPKIEGWPANNISTTAYYGGAAAPAKASFATPTPDQPLLYTGAGDNVTQFSALNSIYTFEAPAGSVEGRDTNTCLVIGGYYMEGDVISYYRVDLRDRTTGTYMALLRNHRYIVDIVSVAGHGYPTPEDAFYGSARLEAEIIDWTEKPVNTIVDGQYFLSVDKDLVELKGSGKRKEFTAETNYNISDQGFPAGLQMKSTEVVYGPEGSGWLTIDNVNGPLERNIGMTATRNDAGKIRTAKVMLKAGNMTKAIDVTQIPAGILASPGMIGYTEDTHELTLRGSAEYKSNADIRAAAEEMFPGEGLHEQTVYAAYFKWGSLIATGSSNQNYDLFGADDVIWVPDEYNDPVYGSGLEGLKAKVAAQNTSREAWNAIPGRTTDAEAVADRWSMSPAQGLGNPCALFGNEWRIPTGGTANGGWNGGTFGTEYKSKSSVTDGTLWIDESQKESYNLPVGGIVASDGSGGQDWSMFLPGAGIIMVGSPYYNDVSVSLIGSGYYWSDEPNIQSNGTVNGGYDFNFTTYSLTGLGVDAFNFGETIRCVKEPVLPDPPGGITKETSTGGGGRAIGPNTYVGAFWRAGEKGERLIKIPVTTAAAAGKWKVMVYSYGGNGIYPMTNGNPFDPAEGVGTDFKKGDIIFGAYDGTVPNNLNAESNPVTGGEEFGGTVENGGEIAFRIGLKQTWNGSAPRYAVAVVSYGFRPDNPEGAYHQLIFLRQGEQDDYVMRQSEPAYPGNSMTDRPLARKWSPYNLTAQKFKGAGVSTDGTNSNGNAWVNVRPTWGAVPSVAEPTDYPTQAGAYFKWAATEGVKAYNPNGTPDYNDIWGWEDYRQIVSVAWDATDPTTAHGGGTVGDNYESCPPGYRRPMDGNTLTIDMMTVDLNESETFQSLYSNVEGGGEDSGNRQNSVWGRYADGFFDRQTIVDAVGSNRGRNSAVSIDNSAVAYIGRLFHNPTSHNSLFFPASGFRTPALNHAGDNGDYWSSSSVDDGLGWLLVVNDVAASRNQGDRNKAFSVRCVVDE